MGEGRREINGMIEDFKENGKSLSIFCLTFGAADPARVA